MNKFRFELTGQMPILFHHDNVEAADDLKKWRDDPANKGKSVAGDDRSPPWTWMTYLYSDDEHVSMPAENIMVALRKAAAQITMKKQTSFKSASQSGLLIDEEHCEFRGPKGRVRFADLKKLMDLDFAAQAKRAESFGVRLFVKRAVVERKKHVRVRPRFESWSVAGHIQVIDSTITPAILKQMFDLAGQYAGLGDWRPSAPKSPGPYGRFAAKLIGAK
jgi:hypothetical protein